MNGSIISKLNMRPNVLIFPMDQYGQPRYIHLEGTPSLQVFFFLSVLLIVLLLFEASVGWCKLVFLIHGGREILNFLPFLVYVGFVWFLVLFFTFRFLPTVTFFTFLPILLIYLGEMREPDANQLLACAA